MYIKHIDFYLFKAILIYVTGRPNNVHFPMHKEAFLYQEERSICSLECCSGFSISQKEQFKNSNLSSIYDK